MPLENAVQFSNKLRNIETVLKTNYTNINANE